MPIYMDILNFMFNDETSEIKIILMGHFSLTTIGAIGSYIPIIYLFYNLPLILLLFCSLKNKNKKTLDSLRTVMGAEICGIIIDAFYLVAEINNVNKRPIFVALISIVVVCGQLISRPFVVLYILKQKDVIETLPEDEDNIDGSIEEVTVENNPFEEPPRKR